MRDCGLRFQHIFLCVEATNYPMTFGYSAYSLDRLPILSGTSYPLRATLCGTQDFWVVTKAHSYLCLPWLLLSYGSGKIMKLELSRGLQSPEGEAIWKSDHGLVLCLGAFPNIPRCCSGASVIPPPPLHEHKWSSVPFSATHNHLYTSHIPLIVFLFCRPNAYSYLSRKKWLFYWVCFFIAEFKQSYSNFVMNKEN